MILKDGYDSRGKRINENSRICDIIVYYDDEGFISHTGLVMEVDEKDKVTLVESKWGGLGRYRHGTDDSVYGIDWEIFRRRHGKEVKTAPSNYDDAAKQCMNNNQLVEAKK